jgi:hypothetical protein
MTNVIITLFLMTIYGVMVGGISQMREIVKEAEIYKRERLVNLQIFPYIFSKVWIAALLAFYQAAAYVIVHYIAFDMPGGVIEFVLIYITMVLVTFAGMMLGLFASAIAPNGNSAPLIVIILILPQIVLGGAIVPVPTFVSAPTSTRWALEAMMSVSGAGSDVIADICWALPPEIRDSMTMEQKLANNCKCLGVNLLNPDSCNHPGIGAFRVGELDGPLPVEPVRPPDPVLPERPVQPEDQSDSIAMADYFAKLQAWEAEATAIQTASQEAFAQYERDLAVYIEARKNVETSVAPAEGVVRTFYNAIYWGYVNKEDKVAYYGKVITAWFVQMLICLLLFVAILIFQKRKDVI